jgi:hypothetical protein
MIDIVTAGRIASEWHGGQWSHLYGFQSSGLITDRDGLLAEIDSCLRSAGDDEELQDLRAFVAASGGEQWTEMPDDSANPVRW